MTDNVTLATQLIKSQFPQWSELPIRAVASTGTDNHLLRLGDDMVIRLPAVEAAAKHAQREARWLPWFADKLRARSALQLPAPIAVGNPELGFPWPFAVCHWFDGSDARVSPPANQPEAAQSLAEFVLALRELPTDEAPRPGKANVGRGCDLLLRDEAVRRSVQQLTTLELIDPAPVLNCWQRALDAETWKKPPQWHHGDLHSGNLLTRDERLTAVIDWGLMAAGDPAVDLLAAWYVFDDAGRETYRHALEADEASWQRGRGWALSMALIAWPYYLQSNPTVAEESELIVRKLLREPY
ncbi:MAG: aminoglycoside phosphotransferase family protein [Pseudomonadaceae bacterium]|nr:aminoglycoside phosphotransferase family protein [Pseudomonadaceae bacterium]